MPLLLLPSYFHLLLFTRDYFDPTPKETHKFLDKYLRGLSEISKNNQQNHPKNDPNNIQTLDELGPWVEAQTTLPRRPQYSFCLHEGVIIAKGFLVSRLSTDFPHHVYSFYKRLQNTKQAPPRSPQALAGTLKPVRPRGVPKQQHFLRLSNNPSQAVNTLSLKIIIMLVDANPVQKDQPL